MKSISAILSAFILSTQAESDVTWTSMGQFDLKHAAFPSVTSFHDSDPFLLISTFNGSPIGKGKVYVVPGVEDAVKNDKISDLAPVALDMGSQKLLWPNDVAIVPEDVFGSDYRAIVIPDGFLVPGHTDGGVYVAIVDKDDITKVTEVKAITHNEGGYFFHMGFWVDLNGDGRKDFITAATNCNPDDGLLVWYEHPEDWATRDEYWPQHIISQGPDVSIMLDQEHAAKDSIIIFAAEFFAERLSMHEVSTKTGELVQSRIIDDTILAAYSVNVTTLNGGTDQQLLVNNHQNDEKTNGIFAYNFPKDIWNDEWVKTTLASGFVSEPAFTKGMAPGFTYEFYPNSSDQAAKKEPHILVAGDGDYEAHIMTHTGDLTFDIDTIVKEGGTVGALAWSDLDGNGWQELWVPNYNAGNVEVFQFSAKSQEFLQ